MSTESLLPSPGFWLGGIVRKSIRDRWVSVAAVTAALVFYAAFALGIYSSFGDEAVSLIQNMPDALAALYGTNDGTAVGLVTSATFSILAPLILLAYAIAGGKNTAVGEEQAETLDLLLSTPVSRTRALLGKAWVLAAAIVVVSVLNWRAMELIGPLVGLDVSAQNIFAATVHLIGLAWMFAAFTLAICAWTGSPVGAAIGGALAGVSYLATTLLPIDPDLADLAKFTPWHLYSGGEPLITELRGHRRLGTCATGGLAASPRPRPWRGVGRRGALGN